MDEALKGRSLKRLDEQQDKPVSGHRHNWVWNSTAMTWHCANCPASGDESMRT